MNLNRGRPLRILFFLNLWGWNFPPQHIAVLNVFPAIYTINHLHISHNALYLPPKILHNLCFLFLLGITFWGANNLCRGRCASGVWDRFFPPGVCRIFFSEFRPLPLPLSCTCIILLVQGWLPGWLGITTMHMYKRTFLDEFFHGMFLERLCLK